MTVHVIICYFLLFYIIVFILCFLLYIHVMNFSIFTRPPSPASLHPGDVVTVVNRVLKTIVAVLCLRLL